MVRGLLQDNKSLGPVRGPGQLQPQAQSPPGLLQDSWERAGLTAPSPAKQGLRITKRDVVAWSCREESKYEVINPLRPFVPAGERRELGLNRPWRGQSRVYLERWAVREVRPLLVWSGRIEQEEFIKKKKWKKRHSGAVWGILQQPLQPLPHPATPWWCGRPWGECTPWRASAHIWDARESTHHEKPCARTGSPEESTHPNLQDQRLLGSWVGGWPSTNQELRRVKLSPPQPPAAKKTSKTGLASLKPAGGFSFFLFKLILYYFFIISFFF